MCYIRGTGYSMPNHAMHSHTIFLKKLMDTVHVLTVFNHLCSMNCPA